MGNCSFQKWLRKGDLEYKNAMHNVEQYCIRKGIHFKEKSSLGEYYALKDAVKYGGDLEGRQIWELLEIAAFKATNYVNAIETCEHDCCDKKAGKLIIRKPDKTKSKI